MKTPTAAVAVAVATLLSAVGVRGEESQIPSRDLLAGGDKNKRYFLVGPRKGVSTPRSGLGLIVVLPGGDGSASFRPFVKRIYEHAVPKTYLVVQPIAVKWTPQQKIIWPTARDKLPGKKFSTEEFVKAVIIDVARRYKLDRRRIFSLSWSSGGPAAYAMSLEKQRIVQGSFIAMSVFYPERQPPLERAKGHAYYLYHSPEDKTCRFALAENATKLLKQNGADVKLVTYEGGHTWKGDVYGDIEKGIRWLEASAR